MLLYIIQNNIYNFQQQHQKFTKHAESKESLQTPVKHQARDRYIPDTGIFVIIEFKKHVKSSRRKK